MYLDKKQMKMELTYRTMYIHAYLSEDTPSSKVEILNYWNSLAKVKENGLRLKFT